MKWVDQWKKIDKSTHHCIFQKWFNREREFFGAIFYEKSKTLGISFSGKGGVAQFHRCPVGPLPIIYMCCVFNRPGEARAAAFRLGSNPFSQVVSQLELYSQLQLSLQSDPIALDVPIFTYLRLVMIQCYGHLA